MFFDQPVLPVIGALALTLAAAAQNPGSGVYNNPGSAAPPLPNVVESRSLEHDRTIGNSWLGGSVHAYVSQVRMLQNQGAYRLAHTSFEIRGTANVLQTGVEVAEIVAFASSVLNSGQPQTSGLYREEVLGVTVTNTPFSVVFGTSAVSQFALIPGGTTSAIPVGPVVVSVHANATCEFARVMTAWSLASPGSDARVLFSGYSRAHAFADAHVAASVPASYAAGVAIQGEIFEHTLRTQVPGPIQLPEQPGQIVASALNGLTGDAIYTLQPTSLLLRVSSLTYAATTWLCFWSGNQVVRSLQ